mgnify:FL=1
MTEKESIQNFIRNVKTLDWNGKGAETIEFSRSKNTIPTPPFQAR